MALNRRKLQGLIEYSDLRNENGIYTEEDVIGVSTEKQMIPTKANLDGVSLRQYKIFAPGWFAFVADTSRRGDKMALAYNNTDRTYIVSTWYVVFRVCEEAEETISPDYLFLYFNRTEFDRYARANSWGSAREYFWFTDMEEIIIDIPDISIQNKYVSIYKAMVANQAAYERGLEDLKLTIDAELDRIKHNAKAYALSSLVKETDIRNENGVITAVHGVNKDKLFMPSVTSGDDLTKYKLVKPMQFACNLMHVGRDVVVPIALNTSDGDIIVSPAYIVFELNTDIVLSQYILMWLSRNETDRYAWFLCDNSVRSGMEKKRFFEISIPCPEVELQRAIVEIHSVYTDRKAINEKLKAQIKDICPILIKGSLEEGK